jgi:hypothetical protein
MNSSNLQRPDNKHKASMLHAFMPVTLRFVRLTVLDCISPQSGAA